MSQINIHIDPLSTNCVLKYLGLAIDEIKLIRSIRSLTEQVIACDEMKFDIGRRRYLVSELQFLNKRLDTLREKARLHQRPAAFAAGEKRAVSGKKMRG